MGQQLHCGRDRSVCQAAIGVTRDDPEIRAAGDRLAQIADALTARKTAEAASRC